MATVGVDDAASIDVLARGRAIVSAGGQRTVVQSALSAPDDVEHARTRWGHVPPPRRPWRAPLADVITAADLPEQAEEATEPWRIPLGLLDRPESQDQPVAEYDPRRQGHLLVLGAARSGLSTVATTIVTGAPVALVLARRIDVAWDELLAVERALADAPRDRLLVIDDVDALLARFDGEQRLAVADRLVRIGREGPARGIRMVLTAQRLTAELHAVAAVTSARLHLRHASRQDLVLAGGDATLHDPRMPPGRGEWQGHRIQVLSTALRPESDAVAAMVDGDGRPRAIVSGRSASLRTLFEQRHHVVLDPEEVGDVAALAAEEVVVGDAEQWQSRWGLLAALRPTREVLFDRCAPGELRALARSRGLPPPVLDDDVALRQEPDGTWVRVRL